MVGKELCTNSTQNTYTGRAEDSPGVVVGVVVVVEEAGGAVETERGGWEVGGTAEDEEQKGENTQRNMIGLALAVDTHVQTLPSLKSKSQ